MQKQFHISLKKVISLSEIEGHHQFTKTSSRLVHPEDTNDLSYWTKKWRISPVQLNDAILNTGSLDPIRLRQYLKKYTWQKFTLGFLNLLKAENSLLHVFKNYGHKTL